MTQLTQEELDKCTEINFVALDLLSEQNPNIKQPCLLCIDTEALNKAKSQFVDFINENMNPVVPLTMDTAEEFIKGNLPSEMLDKLIERERILKEARENGNPKAYFLP